MFLLSLDLYSTHAYQAPPMRVTDIPRAFVVVMVRLKRDTENRIVKTCLTFARKEKSRLSKTITWLRNQCMTNLQRSC